VKCLLLANHDNIVKLFGFTKAADNRTIVAMEYADCGSVYNFLHDKGIEKQEIQVSIFGKLNWMLQCAKVASNFKIPFRINIFINLFN